MVKTIKSYRYFDVGYEMSVIRKTPDINQEELDKIIEIGEMVHPREEIDKRLENAKVNYGLKR